MIRDALLIYAIYSAALLVAGLIGYVVLRVFSEDIEDIEE